MLLRRMILVGVVMIMILLLLRMLVTMMILIHLGFVSKLLWGIDIFMNGYHRIMHNGINIFPTKFRIKQRNCCNQEIIKGKKGKRSVLIMKLTTTVRMIIRMIMMSIRYGTVTREKCHHY